MRAKYVNPDEASNLRPERRTAWVCRIAEQVLDLFSPNLSTYYPLRASVDLAWKVVAGQQVPAATLEEQFRVVEASVPAGEEEGYDSCFFMMIGQLLKAAAYDDVHAACNVIDEASLCVAAYCCYQQGINSVDPVVPADYVDEAGEAAYHFGREVFDFCRQNQDGLLQRSALDRFVLRIPIPPLPPFLVAMAAVLPPEHEQPGGKGR